MDIDGSGAIDDADEAVEDLIGNGHFGKILIVNNNDDDHDGIPDYADGFSIQGGSSNSDPDYRNANEQFAKLQIKLSGPVDLDEPCFRFSYTQIHPQDVIYRTDSGYPKYEFPQISGGLRIWRKPGQEARSPSDLLHDGDFVAAGTVYTARQLGFTQECGGSIDLWVEAVQRSPQYYPFVITFTRVGGFSDHIRVTTVEFGFARVQGDAILAPKQTVEVSQPSPEFSQTSIHVGNLHRSADGKKLLADVTFTGSLTDKASNLIPGQAGIIDCLAVNLNGLPLLNSQGTAHVVNVIDTKSDGHGTLLEPHLYGGSFTQTLQAVEVQPGVNHFQLVATNAFGYSGYAEVDFDVAVVVPQSRLIYSILEFVAAEGANPDRIVLTLSTTDRGNERSVFELSRLPGTETYVSAPATPERNGYSISIIDQEPEGDLIVSMTEWNTRGITFDDYRYVCTRGQNPGTDFYEGQLLITDVDYSTWNAHEISIDNLSNVSASSGGTFKPQLIEILAAPELIAAMGMVTLGGENSREYSVTQVAGRFFVSQDADGVPRAFLVVDHRTLDHQLDAIYGDRRYGPWHFASGFGAGVYGSAVGLVDGIVVLARGGWHLVRHYNALSVAVRVTNGQGLLTIEDQRKVDALGSMIDTIMPIVEQLHDGGPEIVYAVLSGDPLYVGSLSEENRLIAEFIVEVIEEIRDQLDAMDDYEAGYICGLIAGEIATDIGLAVASGGIALVTKSATMGRVLSRLDEVPGIPASLGPRLVDVAQTISRMSTTRMCFVAGTLVATPAGSVPIELIQPGDIVWSASDDAGPLAIRVPARVLRTIITHPELIHTVTYRAADDLYVSIDGTAEHPFFVVNDIGEGRSCGEWRPLAELRAGDELVLLNTGPAWIVDIAARPREIRTATYNLEVEKSHTYFVGPPEAELWVHNAGGTACERTFGIYDRFKRREGLQGDPIEAWKRTLLRFETINGRRLDSATLRTATIAVMKDVYENLPRLSNGSIDFDKISWIKMRDAWAGNLDRSDLENHHTAVSRLAKRMYVLTRGSDPPANWEDRMPGFVLPRTAHNVGQSDIPGMATFHDMLNNRVPYGPQLLDLSVEDIRDRLRNAYDDFADQNLLSDGFDFRRVKIVMDEWLEQEVFQP